MGCAIARKSWSPPCILFSYAHNNLKKLIEDVVGGEDFIVISRRDAPNAVLLSLDSFNGLMETVHLLKSPANAARLACSLAQMEQRYCH
ncbi:MULTISPECIES: type II toxin-antitoxin system Phd/YefM family antitoxin [unclassified Pseudomonas]|uniref:type II toxin-antitoxin system Phd/YefM family antitoxin n=1 Tax=unclassified Pseudomonas TaxID=196821 RepID=UPI0002E76109|nr:type II toxin-antitoxin system Phd/YefM family antitoxin [Pseudomonas sp. M1]MBB1605844.1 prevent-host-death protein [Pseudomonas sp. UMC76]MBB1639109.1 prevent-host-death protein [Pseudomonas sp. UME83]NTX89059.1 type II toxin-antitoxin system Phd/YefM family antitoxin [Pseudomonas sp. UMA643]NTY17747.1 type II toxin-antitoxin system Phd/YefM family antitoxin [Pseudomonas sp. UMC3103]NTY25023.1 type II toxin-antitoxin system Phd/YefM family antitoxin [Pseudomonas sp. UMA603]NTY30445.1 typ